MSNPTNGPDLLVGTGGSDFIDGLAGNDSIYGNGGGDILVGNLGNDYIHGGSGSDLVTYTYSSVGVLASLKDGTASGASGDQDTLVGIENLWGSAHRDWLLGNSGVNELFGANGNDYLEGMEGADKISGGSGSDMASYYLSNAGVYVNLKTGTAMFGHAEGDTFFSIEDLNGSGFADQLQGLDGASELRGQGGDDLLRGEGGIDRLMGGEGNDRIVGGLGADHMSGGSHADRFIYESADSSTPASRDRIDDFSKAEGDRIDLSALDAKAHASGDQSFSFIGKDTAFWAEGQVRYVQQNGMTIVEANLVEGGGADMAIRLDGLHQLAASDFML